MKRLFIGVPVPEAIKKKVLPLWKELQEVNSGERNLSLVSPENIHFTVKFLGEVEAEKIPLVIERMDRLVNNKKIFSVNIQKVGVFPSSADIRVIWIGAESKELVSLMKNTDAELGFIRKNEHKEEIPHLTLARVKFKGSKELLAKFVEKHQQDDFGKMVVDKVVLYESKLTLEGPVYSEIRTFMLNKN